MPVKLHTCPLTFVKLEGHGCHRVRKALEEKGIEYELVKEPLLRGQRTKLEELSGQRVLPVLELEGGRAVREESADLAAKIRSGELP